MRQANVFLAAILLIAVLCGCSKGTPSDMEVSAEPYPEAVEAGKTAEALVPETEKAAESKSKEESPLKKDDTAQPKSEKATPSKQQTSTPKSKPVENVTEPTASHSQDSAPTTPASTPGKPEPKPTPSAEPVPAPTPQPKPAEVHTHSYAETVVAPTCAAGGYTKHTCACGDSYTDKPTEALGHAYEQTGHADATTASAGYTEYTCSRCGASYRDAIPQLVQTGASASDAQQVCNTVNSYIQSHYAATDRRGTYMGITWVTSSSDVQGAINSAISTVDLYAQYYNAKSFWCSYTDDGGGSYTIVLYWDTV